MTSYGNILHSSLQNDGIFQTLRIKESTPFSETSNLSTFSFDSFTVLFDLKECEKRSQEKSRALFQTFLIDPKTLSTN